MNFEDMIFEAMGKAMGSIVNADRVAGDIAEKTGVEENLKSTRRLAEHCEELIPSKEGKGAFNLLMCYAYKPFMKQPGVARWCREQANYFLERAKGYGIELPEEKQLPGRGG